MSGFTKGPWTIVSREVMEEDGSVYPAHIVGDERERTVCFLEAQCVAEIAAKQPGTHWDTTPEKQANARLIAAAPELYEHLKEARDAIASLPEYALGGESIYSSHTGEIVGDYPIRDELLHHIDAALSKAAGEGV